MSDRINSEEIRSYSLSAKWAQTHRPECVSAIGLILLTWNRTEESLAWTISGIMGISFIGDEGIAHSHDWILTTVMAETATVHARIKIVDAILKKALEGHALNERWKGLKKSIVRLAEQRNIVVHTRWVWSENLPQYLIQIDRDQRFWGWTEAHFLQLCAEIKTLEDELQAFKIEIAGELRSGTLSSPYLTPKVQR